MGGREKCKVVSLSPKWLHQSTPNYPSPHVWAQAIFSWGGEVYFPIFRADMSLLWPREYGKSNTASFSKLGHKTILQLGPFAKSLGIFALEEVSRLVRSLIILKPLLNEEAQASHALQIMWRQMINLPSSILATTNQASDIMTRNLYVSDTI